MNGRWNVGRSLTPLGVALSYVVIGSLWVLASDQLVLPWHAYDDGIASLLASAKNLLFVLVTGGLVWALTQAAVRGHRQRLNQAFGRERQLRALIETLPVPLLVVRIIDGRVLYANVRGHLVLEKTGIRRDRAG